MADRDPVCEQLRRARQSRGWSLQAMSQRMTEQTGEVWPAVTIGSYERGDREPPLSRLREWAGFLDHEVLVVGPGNSDDAASTWKEFVVVFSTIVDGEQREERITCGDEAEAERIHEAIPFSRLLTRVVSAGEWEKI